MNDPNVFNAIRDSQDGKTLSTWTLRNQAALDESGWDFFDALNALLVLVYREAPAVDDLATDLSYAKGQIDAALKAVRKEAVQS